ncbi:MAG: hypothetical protein H6708_14680 [Kofleriaceae bacterium]|nr:hypothetical protein [Kofleriaceae bacterium]
MSGAGRAWACAAVVALAVVTAPAAAHAGDLRLGLFAPAAPFESTAARQDYASKLASHLAEATGGAGVGRVYARASDLAAAIKKKEIDVAVVDAAYLAATGSTATVLAIATRGGDPAGAWQVIGHRDVEVIAQLEGERLLTPTVGGHEADFVLDALLGGELPRTFFRAIDTAPDVASVLAALALGRADAAVVPVGVDLPDGTARIATLPAVSWPALVAFGGVAAATRRKLTAAAETFAGGAALKRLPGRRRRRRARPGPAAGQARAARADARAPPRRGGRRAGRRSAPDDRARAAAQPGRRSGGAAGSGGGGGAGPAPGPAPARAGQGQGQGEGPGAGAAAAPVTRWPEPARWTGSWDMLEP